MTMSTARRISPAKRSSLRLAPAIFAVLAAAFAVLLAGPAAAAPQEAMSFHLVTGGGCPQSGCIVASGEIRGGSARDFAAFAGAAHLQPGALMLLHSRGGDLVGAMKLGLSLRHARVSTRVQTYDLGTGATGAGSCSSSCAYAFLGGVQRTLGAGAKLGLNQFTPASAAPDVQLADAQRLLGLISTYTQAMGAASELAAVGLDVPAQGMHWLSTAELSQYAVLAAA
jgi:hypothetical protein